MSAKRVQPFAEAYPAPWSLGEGEVLDRDGYHVNGFDGDDADEVEFWRGIVDAVNHQAATAARASSPAPSGARRASGDVRTSE